MWRGILVSAFVCLLSLPVINSVDARSTSRGAQRQKQVVKQQKERLKKSLKQEIDTANARLKAIAAEKEKAAAELASGKGEVADLKSRLEAVKSDEAQKAETAKVARQLIAANYTVKGAQKKIDAADAALVEGRKYLATLEARYRKMGGKVNQTK